MVQRRVNKPTCFSVLVCTCEDSTDTVGAGSCDAADLISFSFQNKHSIEIQDEVKDRTGQELGIFILLLIPVRC